MKKFVLFLMMAALLSSCAKEVSIPVYVWGSFSRDTGEDALREQFSLFRQHGV